MLATAGVAGASAASASTIQRHQPPRAAYGSVELGSPLQYETFLAFQSNAFQGNRFHGSVDYTNWTYAEPFSGSGSYNGGGITWTLKGQVTDHKVRATIAYDGQSYKVYLSGRVADDGS